MDNSKNYQIKITGENFNLDHQITPLQLAKIISFLLLPIAGSSEEDTSVKIASANESTNLPNNSTIISAMRAREFMNEKNPKTIPQQIAVYLLYFKQTQQDPVTIEQL